MLQSVDEVLRLFGDGRPVDAIRLLKQAGMSLKDAHSAVDAMRNIRCRRGIECACARGVHAWLAIQPGPDLHMAVDKNGVPWQVRARSAA